MQHDGEYNNATHIAQHFNQQIKFRHVLIGLIRFMITCRLYFLLESSCKYAGDPNTTNVHIRKAFKSPFETQARHFLYFGMIHIVPKTGIKQDEIKTIENVTVSNVYGVSIVTTAGMGAKERLNKSQT
jgi:hypothetical protein